MRSAAASLASDSTVWPCAEAAWNCCASSSCSRFTADELLSLPCSSARHASVSVVTCDCSAATCVL